MGVRANEVNNDASFSGARYVRDNWSDPERQLSKNGFYSMDILIGIGMYFMVFLIYSTSLPETLEEC